MPSQKEINAIIQSLRLDLANARIKAATKKSQLGKVWAQYRVSVTRPIYNIAERLFGLDLLSKIQPSIGVLYDVEMISFRLPTTINGKPVALENQNVSLVNKYGRATRTYDLVQYRPDAKIGNLALDVAPIELKSEGAKTKKSGVVVSSVKGGLSLDDILVHFRDSSTISNQIRKEKKLIQDAIDLNAKIILRGKEVVTNRVVEIEIDPRRLQVSRIVAYDGSVDKVLLDPHTKPVPVRRRVPAGTKKATSRSGRTSSGEIVVPQRGSVTQSGRSARPVSSAGGEINVPQRGLVTQSGQPASSVSSTSGEIDGPQRGSVTQSGRPARPVTSTSGEITNKTRLSGTRGTARGVFRGVAASVGFFAAMALRKYIQGWFADSFEKDALEKINKAIEDHRDKFLALLESRSHEIQSTQAEGRHVTLHIIIKLKWFHADLGQVLRRATIHSYPLVFEDGPPPKPNPVWTTKGSIKNTNIYLKLNTSYSYKSIDILLPGTDQAARHYRLSRKTIDALVRGSTGKPMVEFEELVLKSYYGGQSRKDLRDYAVYRQKLAKEFRSSRKYFRVRFWLKMEKLTSASIEKVIAQAKVKSISLVPLRAYAIKQRSSRPGYWSKVIGQIDAPLEERFGAERSRYLMSQPATMEEVADQNVEIGFLQKRLKRLRQRLAEASKLRKRYPNEPAQPNHKEKYDLEQQIEVLLKKIKVQRGWLGAMD